MRLIPRLRDSDGLLSITLTLVFIPWMALIAGFVWATYKGTPPDYLGFGTGVSALIAIWVGRKWVKTIEAGAVKVMGDRQP